MLRSPSLWPVTLFEKCSCSCSARDCRIKPKRNTKKLSRLFSDCFIFLDYTSFIKWETGTRPRTGTSSVRRKLMILVLPSYFVLWIKMTYTFSALSQQHSFFFSWLLFVPDYTTLVTVRRIKLDAEKLMAQTFSLWAHFFRVLNRLSLSHM